MDKVAIFTLNGYFNYGNRLQNYATQEVLKSLGLKAETVVVKNKPLPITRRLTVTRISYLMNMKLKEALKRIHFKVWTNINKNKVRILENSRTEIFKIFTSDHILETDYCISDNNIPNDLSDRYDYFITGSDQVWNPSYIYGLSIYFLTFADKHKRIAFSPSFGVSVIEPKYKKNYKEWISGMHKLSVREDTGAKIIKDLTGREAPVLVDPTLMLTKDEWMSISKKATNKPSSNYLLTYFLGGIPENHKKQINDLAKKNRLKVINLGDIREKEAYTAGPSEFIDYVDGCSIFCTDSFHGAIFSILMEKPFIIYERMGSSFSMFSRLNTLLDKFDLNSRRAEKINTSEEAFNIDFSHIPPILEAERNKALDYLKNALDIKDAK